MISGLFKTWSLANSVPVLQNSHHLIGNVENAI
jgi:hypothetical protein